MQLLGSTKLNLQEQIVTPKKKKKKKKRKKKEHIVTTNLHTQREGERESNGCVSSSPKIFILVFLELGLHFFSSLFPCLAAEKE
jgi:hypothetical protein